MSKLVKKIFVLCLILCMLPCGINGYAYSEDTLSKMGVISSELSDDTIVTREVFAGSIARLLSSGDNFKDTVSSFSDVSEDNIYLGEIEYLKSLGVMSGDGTGNFYPKDKITVYQAVKVLCSICGYGKIGELKGGYPNGFLNVASELRILNNVYAENGNVTVADLKTMLLNLLSVPVIDSILYAENGEIHEEFISSKDSKTFAEKYLSLHEYKATVKIVDTEKYTLKAEIEKDESGTYRNGEEVLFTVSSNLEIKSLENAPVTIIADYKNNIVDISPAKGVEIKYGVVDSVNNTFENTPYYVDFLSSLTIKEDESEYDFAENFKVFYNGKSNSQKLLLMEKYVKLIIKDEEIICLETWDLTDAGIITGIDYNNIYYTAGNSELRLSSLLDFVKMYVIIDGESRNLSELSEGMIFSYYKDQADNSIVLVATSKKMSDVFSGLKEEKIILGNNDLNCASDCYYRIKENYVPANKADKSSLLNREITVLFDIYSNVKYIAPVDEMSVNNILGFLVGVDEDIFGSMVCRVFDIENGGEPKDYPLKDNAYFENGLIKSNFVSTAGVLDGSELFEFKINSKGEIYSVKEPYKFDGFESAMTTPTRFGDGTTRIYMPVEGRNLYFDASTPIKAVYKEKDKYKTRDFTFSELNGLYCSGITMRFYGYPESSDVRFALITGDVFNVYRINTFGILTDMYESINEDGEICYTVKVDGAEYEISSEVVEEKGIHNNMYVEYRKKAFDPSGIIIDSTIDISDEFKNWSGRKGKQLVLIGGVVKKADDKRIMLEDGTDYFYRQGSEAFYNLTGNHKFELSDYKDLTPGTEVILAVVSKDVYTVISNGVN